MIKKIEKIYKDFIRKKAESGGRRPGLHVSDLVKDCVRQPWYRMAGTKQEKISDDSITAFYYGTTIHESFQGMFDVMEFEMSVNPYTEQTSLDFKDVLKEINNNPFEWVSGSADAIIEDKAILDFKTTSKLSTPPFSYVTQLNFYSYMYYLYTGIFIDKGYIFMLEKQSGFKKKKIFEYKLEDPEVNQLRIQIKMDEIKSDETPVRTESVLCNWCPFLNVCKPQNYLKLKL